MLSKNRGLKAAAGIGAAVAAFGLSAAFAAPALATDIELAEDKYDLAMSTATVRSGDTYKTTITITNDGEKNAEDVHFRGMSTNATVAVNGQGWDCNVTGLVAKCDGPDLDVDKATQLTFTQTLVDGSHTVGASFRTDAWKDGEWAGKDKDYDNNDGEYFDRVASKPSVSGRVFNDADKDGIQDAGETGIADVKFAVYSGDVAIFNGTTDANGKYAVHYLGEGSYSVFVDSPSPWKRSVKDVGADDTIDSDVDVSTGFSAIFKCEEPEIGPSVAADEKAAAEALAQASERGWKKCEAKIDAGLYKDAPGAGGGTLPITGSAATTVALGGAAVLAAGGALAFAARRRRNGEAAA